jgi:hypothetical protein
MNRSSQWRWLLFGVGLAIAASVGACGSCSRGPCPGNSCPGVDGGESDAAPSISDSGTDAGIDAGKPSTPFSRFCDTYATELCAWMVQCNQWYSADQADCVGFYQSSLCDDLWGASEAKGFLGFDTNAASVCLTALSNPTTCDPNLTIACGLAVPPQSGTGQPCLTNLDCSGLVDVCAGTPCAASCQATGGLGQPCSVLFLCYPGLWCDSTSEICRAPQPPGSPCDGLQPAECDGTSYCDTAIGSCMALPTVGQSCSGTPCAAGLYCDGTSTCQPDPVGSEPCSASAPCAPGFYCGASSTCVASILDGGACAQGECAEGLVCRGGQCLPPGSNGVACASDADCQFPLFCDPVLLECEPLSRAVLGEACTGAISNCIGQTNCKGVRSASDGGAGTAGTCQPSNIGDPCSTGLECPQGSACVSSDGGGGACQPSAAGSPCTGDLNCVLGQYCLLSQGQVCRLQLTQGQVCHGEPDNDCGNPLKCVGLADGGAVCEPPGVVGSSCGGKNSCIPPLVCIDAQCLAAGGTGQPCATRSPECFGGACQADAGVCVPPLSNGEPCRSSIECASGNCVAAVCQAACP